MFGNLKAAFVVVSAIAVFGLSAATGFGETGTNAGAEKAVAVGNRICPVTGEKIDKNSEVTYEYKGKVYSFCCRGCIVEFSKDPEKYIGKLKKDGEVLDKKAAH